MSERPQMTIWVGDHRAKTEARRLVRALDEFNAQHPDPDAEAVADNFDYLTYNYIVQMCASTLAESYIMVPNEAERLEMESRDGDLRSALEGAGNLKTMQVTESQDDENEVETS